MSLPGEAAPEEVLRRLPREAWPLARFLNALLMKMGRTGLLAKPRRGPQAGKSGDRRSENADINDGHEGGRWREGIGRLAMESKPTTDGKANVIDGELGIWGRRRRS